MMEPTLDRPGLRSYGSEDSDPTRLARGDSTPPGSGGERHPLDHLAEEFAERCRRGESPSIAEYEARFPDQTAQVRKLLGAVAMMEQLRRGSKQARYLPERIGEFRILRELGRGGMGVVYEAVQESLWRHVAVKAIHHTQLDSKRLQRFQREAQAVAQLHHTNIVPIFGVGEHDGIPYYAMQYIRGRGLDALLDSWRRDGLLPSRERWRIAARYVAQTAEALGYAHEQGILHRDIKPANLLIDEHDAVWVTDFGLAKMVGHDELTASGDVVGTLRYLAPESLRGHSEARSDVYSLGLTLYELLTLRPPFGDLSPSELLHQVNEGRPVRPRAVDPSIPRDLETIVLKATAREPKDRYRTAYDLGQDLRRYLEDRPIRARQATEFERAWRWSRRNPVMAGLIVLTAASVLLAAVFGWTRSALQTQALADKNEILRKANTDFNLISQLFLKLLHDQAPPDVQTTDDDIPLTQAETALERNRGDRSFADGPRGGPPDRLGFPREINPANDHGGPPFDDRRGPGRFGPGGPDGFGNLGGPGGRPPDEMGGPGWFGPHGPNRDAGPHGLMGGRIAQGEQSTQQKTMTSLRALLEAYDQFANRNKTNPPVQSQAGGVYFTVGQLHQQLGEQDEADHAFGRSLQIFDQLSILHPDHPEYFGPFLKICTLANPWQTEVAALEPVADRLKRLETILGRLVKANPNDKRYQRSQMQILAKTAIVRSRLGQNGADASFERALQIADSLVAHAPEEATPHTDRADVREAYGLLRDAQGQSAAARQLFEEALEDLDWVAFAGLPSLPLAMRMEALADRFEVLLGDKKRGDEIQLKADRIDPRPPITNRPKAGRPFGRFRPETIPTAEEADAP